MANGILNPLPEVVATDQLSGPLQWPTLDPASFYAPPASAPGSISRDPFGPIAGWLAHASLRAAGAAIKGILLSVLVLGVWLGALPAQSWWQTDWHWLGGVMVVGGLALLAGADAGLLACAAVLGVQTIAAVAAQPLVAGGFVAATVAARLVWEGLLALVRR